MQYKKIGYNNMPRNIHKFTSFLNRLSESPFNLSELAADYVLAMQEFNQHPAESETSYLSLRDEDVPDAEDELSEDERISYVNNKLQGGSIQLTLDSSHDLNSSDLKQIVSALNLNNEFKSRIIEILFSADLSNFPFTDLENLKEIFFSNNERHTPPELRRSTIPIFLPELDGLPKLESIWLCDRGLIAGWPNFLNNGALNYLNLENSPMLYPPLSLPLSMIEVHVAHSALVTICNLSRRAMPNLTDFYFIDELGQDNNSNFTIATLIAIKSTITARGGNIHTFANAFNPNEPFIVNNIDYTNVSISEEILGLHFTKFIDALRISVINEQLRLAKIKMFICKFATMCILPLPQDIVEEIMSMAELQCLEIVTHLDGNGVALVDMINDGADEEAKSVVSQYMQHKLPEIVKNAVLEPSFNPAFKKYRAQTNSIADELMARKLAREQDLPREKRPIKFLM